MADIRAITPTRFIAVAHLLERRPLSRKKNIAAPIIATEINQKDPPTTSCGSNNLFMIPLYPSFQSLIRKDFDLIINFHTNQSKNILFLLYFFLESVSAPKINEIKFTKIISIVGSINCKFNQC